MDRLAVLNACLGTMGEAPLNAITDAHPLRYAALQQLENENRRVQTIGRWFNMEKITLSPQASDSRIYLPGDGLAFRHKTRNIVKRGRTLYDLEHGTNIFTEDVEGTLVRLVPFDDLPESAQQRIGYHAIVLFQTEYDGDTAKTRMLQTTEARAVMEESREHIRNRQSNLLESNQTLQRLKSITRGARRNIRAP